MLDTFGYATYAICSMVDPVHFPFSEKEKPNISLKGMLKDKLLAYFNEKEISHKIVSVLSSDEYIEWDRIRNILIHRGQPGRTFYAGGSKNGTVEWIDGIILDKTTLSVRIVWINETLNELMISLRKLCCLIKTS